MMRIRVTELLSLVVANSDEQKKWHEHSWGRPRVTAELPAATWDAGLEIPVCLPRENLLPAYLFPDDNMLGPGWNKIQILKARDELHPGMCLGLTFPLFLF